MHHLVRHRWLRGFARRAGGLTLGLLLAALLLAQLSDAGELEKIIDEVLASSPGQLAQYRGGKEGLFGYFVGQVMKASKGKANPKVVNDLLKEKLKG